MDSSYRISGVLVRIAALVALGGSGCGDGAPAVSSSPEEASVHGTVTYQGKPVASGEIRFNPANSRRPDAAMRTAPIGKDGSYAIKTLVGENTVTLSVPSLAKKEPRLSYTMVRCDVRGGDNTFAVALPRAEQ